MASSWLRTPELLLLPSVPVLLAELEDEVRWLAARAADAPENFGHLLRLLEAERSWAAGEFDAAALAFDAARGEVSGRQRPWHRALITERAARFALARGLQQTGFELLAQARQEYMAWGATAKVAQLDWAYPALRPHADAPGESGVNQAGSASAGLDAQHGIDRPAGDSVGFAGTELGNEHRRAAFPGRRCARRDDRRHRSASCCCGAKTAKTGCCPHRRAA